MITDAKYHQGIENFQEFLNQAKDKRNKDGEKGGERDKKPVSAEDKIVQNDCQTNDDLNTKISEISLKGPNLGWLYYKEYYTQTESLNFKLSKNARYTFKFKGIALGKGTVEIKKNNEGLQNLSLMGMDDNDRLKNAILKELFSDKNNTIKNQKPTYQSTQVIPDITATVRYPGIVIGLGYAHETKSKGEIKMGCSFDHSTGAPIIPGSQIKGMMRSLFPQRTISKKKTHTEEKRDFIIQIIGEKIEEKQPGLLKVLSDKKHLGISDWNIVDLIELDIFEGKYFEISTNTSDEEENNRGDDTEPEIKQKYKSIYERDIFYDAHPEDGKACLAMDVITPHEDDPLKNPKPLPMLKIKGGTTMHINVDFKSGDILTKEQKIELMKNLLSYTGIGAKTNTGYGYITFE